MWTEKKIRNVWSMWPELTGKLQSFLGNKRRCSILRPFNLWSPSTLFLKKESLFHILWYQEYPSFHSILPLKCHNRYESLHLRLLLNLLYIWCLIFLWHQVLSSIKEMRLLRHESKPSSLLILKKVYKRVYNKRPSCLSL